MNKILMKMTGVAVMTLMMVSCGSSKAVDKSESIKARGYFIVGLDDQFPPMGFRDSKKNEIVGFDIDLAKAAAKEMGLEVKFKSVEWDSIILSLNKGDIDVIWNGLTITPERKKKIAFSPAYLANRQIVVVKAGSKLTTLKALASKKVGVQLGSSSEKAIANNKAFASSIKEVKKFENNTLALMDLAAGRVDAVVVDEIVGRYYMSKRKGVYQVLKETLDSEEYGIGMRSTDLSFQKELSEAMDRVKKGKIGEAISNKWFAENILLK